MKFLVHQIYSKEGTFHPEFVSSCNQIELSTKFVMLKKFQSEFSAHANMNKFFPGVFQNWKASSFNNDFELELFG